VFAWTSEPPPTPTLLPKPEPTMTKSRPADISISTRRIAAYAAGRPAEGTGRRTVKVEPFPGSLSAVTSPPMSRA